MDRLLNHKLDIGQKNSYVGRNEILTTILILILSMDSIRVAYRNDHAELFWF